VNAGLSATFSRAVVVLTGGTVFAQALAFAAMPILTRLYTPQNFDLLAVFTSVVALLGVAICLRFNVAIPLPESDDEGADLLALSIIAASVLSLTFALVVTKFGGGLADWIGQPSLERYLWMLPLAIFFAALYDALQYWATRKKRFGLVTRTRITRAVGGVGVQVGAGVLAKSAFGLIFGQLLYYALGVVGIGRSIFTLDRPAFSGMTTERLLKTARTYERYPKVSVTEALLNTAGAELPVIMIAAAAVGPEAGFLMLAMRALGAPMALIGNSVAQVYYVDAREKHRDGVLLVFTKGIMWRLLKWGGVPLVAFGVLAPVIFPFVFGSDWGRAGELAAWLTPSFILQLVASPVSMVLHVTGDLRLSAKLQAYGAILRIGSVAIAAATAPQYVAEAFAISSAAYYGLYINVIIKVLRVS